MNKKIVLVVLAVAAVTIVGIILTKFLMPQGSSDVWLDPFGRVEQLMRASLLPDEKIPARNSFDTADMIIALSRLHRIGETYQFVLSNGNELEASYGERWHNSNPLYGFDSIESVDFMLSIEESRSVIIPEDIYDKMISLANELIEDKYGGLFYPWSTFPIWEIGNIAILKPDIIYEITYGLPDYGKEIELINLLREYSPIDEAPEVMLP